MNLGDRLRLAVKVLSHLLLQQQPPSLQLRNAHSFINMIANVVHQTQLCRATIRFNALSYPDFIANYAFWTGSFWLNVLGATSPTSSPPPSIQP